MILKFLTILLVFNALSANGYLGSINEYERDTALAANKIQQSMLTTNDVNNLEKIFHVNHDVSHSFEKIKYLNEKRKTTNLEKKKFKKLMENIKDGHNIGNEMLHVVYPVDFVNEIRKIYYSELTKFRMSESNFSNTTLFFTIPDLENLKQLFKSKNAHDFAKMLKDFASKTLEGSKQISNFFDIIDQLESQPSALPSVSVQEYPINFINQIRIKYYEKIPIFLESEFNSTHSTFWTLDDFRNIKKLFNYGIEFSYEIKDYANSSEINWLLKSDFMDLINQLESHSENVPSISIEQYPIKFVNDIRTFYYQVLDNQTRQEFYEYNKAIICLNDFSNLANIFKNKKEDFESDLMEFINARLDVKEQLGHFNNLIYQIEFDLDTVPSVEILPYNITFINELRIFYNKELERIGFNKTFVKNMRMFSVDEIEDLRRIFDSVSSEYSKKFQKLAQIYILDNLLRDSYLNGLIQDLIEYPKLYPRFNFYSYQYPLDFINETNALINKIEKNVIQISVWTNSDWKNLQSILLRPDGQEIIKVIRKYAATSLGFPEQKDKFEILMNELPTNSTYHSQLFPTGFVNGTRLIMYNYLMQPQNTPSNLTTFTVKDLNNFKFIVKSGNVSLFESEIEIYFNSSSVDKNLTLAFTNLMDEIKHEPDVLPALYVELYSVDFINNIRINCYEYIWNLLTEEFIFVNSTFWALDDFKNIKKLIDYGVEFSNKIRNFVNTSNINLAIKSESIDLINQLQSHPDCVPSISIDQYPLQFMSDIRTFFFQLLDNQTRREFYEKNTAVLFLNDFANFEMIFNNDIDNEFEKFLVEFANKSFSNKAQLQNFKNLIYHLEYGIDGIVPAVEFLPYPIELINQIRILYFKEMESIGFNNTDKRGTSMLAVDDIENLRRIFDTTSDEFYEEFKQLTQLYISDNLLRDSFLNVLIQQLIEYPKLYPRFNFYSYQYPQRFVNETRSLINKIETKVLQLTVWTIIDWKNLKFLLSSKNSLNIIEEVKNYSADSLLFSEHRDKFEILMNELKNGSSYYFQLFPTVFINGTRYIYYKHLMLQQKSPSSNFSFFDLNDLRNFKFIFKNGNLSSSSFESELENYTNEIDKNQRVKFSNLIHQIKQQPDLVPAISMEFYPIDFINQFRTLYYEKTSHLIIDDLIFSNSTFWNIEDFRNLRKLMDRKNGIEFVNKIKSFVNDSKINSQLKTDCLDLINQLQIQPKFIPSVAIEPYPIDFINKIRIFYYKYATEGQNELIFNLNINDLHNLNIIFESNVAHLLESELNNTIANQLNDQNLRIKFLNLLKQLKENEYIVPAFPMDIYPIEFINEMRTLYYQKIPYLINDNFFFINTNFWRVADFQNYRILIELPNGFKLADKTKNFINDSRISIQLKNVTMDMINQIESHPDYIPSVEFVQYPINFINDIRTFFYQQLDNQTRRDFYKQNETFPCLNDFTNLANILKNDLNSDFGKVLNELAYRSLFNNYQLDEFTNLIIQLKMYENTVPALEFLPYSIEFINKMRILYYKEIERVEFNNGSMFSVDDIQRLRQIFETTSGEFYEEFKQLAQLYIRDDQLRDSYLNGLIQELIEYPKLYPAFNFYSYQYPFKFINETRLLIDRIEANVYKLSSWTIVDSKNVQFLLLSGKNAAHIIDVLKNYANNTLLFSVYKNNFFKLINELQKGSSTYHPQLFPTVFINGTRYLYYNYLIIQQKPLSNSSNLSLEDLKNLKIIFKSGNEASTFETKLRSVIDMPAFDKNLRIRVINLINQIKRWPDVLPASSMERYTIDLLNQMRTIYIESISNILKAENNFTNTAIWKMEDFRNMRNSFNGSHGGFEYVGKIRKFINESDINWELKNNTFDLINQIQSYPEYVPSIDFKIYPIVFVNEIRKHLLTELTKFKMSKSDYSNSSLFFTTTDFENLKKLFKSKYVQDFAIILKEFGSKTLESSKQISNFLDIIDQLESQPSAFPSISVQAYPFEFINQIRIKYYEKVPLILFEEFNATNFTFWTLDDFRNMKKLFNYGIEFSYEIKDYANSSEINWLLKSDFMDLINQLESHSENVPSISIEQYPIKFVNDIRTFYYQVLDNQTRQEFYEYNKAIICLNDFSNFVKLFENNNNNNFGRFLIELANKSLSNEDEFKNFVNLIHRLELNVNIVPAVEFLSYPIEFVNQIRKFYYHQLESMGFNKAGKDNMRMFTVDEIENLWRIFDSISNEYYGLFIELAQTYIPGELLRDSYLNGLIQDLIEYPKVYPRFNFYSYQYPVRFINETNSLINKIEINVIQLTDWTFADWKNVQFILSRNDSSPIIKVLTDYANNTLVFEEQINDFKNLMNEMQSGLTYRFHHYPTVFINGTRYICYKYLIEQLLKNTSSDFSYFTLNDYKNFKFIFKSGNVSLFEIKLDKYLNNPSIDQDLRIRFKNFINQIKQHPDILPTFSSELYPVDFINQIRTKYYQKIFFLVPKEADSTTSSFWSSEDLRNIDELNALFKLIK